MPFVESDGETAAGPAQDLMLEHVRMHGLPHGRRLGAKPSYGPNLTHLASRTTFASGYYKLTRENLIDWVLDAPSMIPMQSKQCRLSSQEAILACVGMPSFVKDTPPGQETMTRDQAEQIADFLLELK